MRWVIPPLASLYNNCRWLHDQIREINPGGFKNVKKNLTGLLFMKKETERVNDVLTLPARYNLNTLIREVFSFCNTIQFEITQVQLIWFCVWTSR